MECQLETRQLLTLDLVSNVFPEFMGEFGNGDSQRSVVSSLGTITAFESLAGNLVEADTNGASDIFIRDLAAGSTIRVSTSSSGGQANGNSFEPSLDIQTAKVFFSSQASNLVSDDQNGKQDIFVKDLKTGQVQRLSTTATGGEANGDSFSPQPSADRTKLIFSSSASNLVPGDTNNQIDIFLKDLTTGAITRVSTSDSGGQANGHSMSPVINSSGTRIAFESDADNLVPGDTNKSRDIFLRDLYTGAIRRVTTSASGVQANAGARSPVFSVDGTTILFQSEASNLVPGDTNGVQDIFVVNLVTASVSRVSTSANGLQTNGASSSPSLSTNGKRVAFTSLATNLGPQAAPDRLSVYVKDLVTGAVNLISTSSPGVPANAAAFRPDLNGDGTIVTFHSAATNLDSGDTGALLDVFVKNTSTGELKRVSPVASPYNRIATGSSLGVALSSNGIKVAFFSQANNLVPDDTNNEADLFVRDLVSGTIIRANTSASGEQANGAAIDASLSADGTKIAFTSFARNLVPNDNNSPWDIFVKDLVTGTIRRVTTAFSGAESNGSSFRPSFSADGKKVAFESEASNLVPADTNGQRDVFVFDLTTSIIRRVSLSAAGTEANSRSHEPFLSADGLKVAFTSDANNLVPGDTNGSLDVFVKDLVTGAITRGSQTASGVQANGNSVGAVLSSDGSMFLFYSGAGNLVPGDTNNETDVFSKDLVTGVVTRISVDAEGLQGDGGSYGVSLSSDGTKAVFSSDASNMVPGDTNDSTDVFIKDLNTGAITRVSTDVNGRQSNGHSPTIVFSADATKAAFSSYATNLVDGDTDDKADIIVKDLSTGYIDVASRAVPWMLSGNGNSSDPWLSADGTKIAFQSSASDLVPQDTNGSLDIFVKDSTTGTTTRVSTTATGVPGNGDSSAPVLSVDGTIVAFQSDATNLVAGDTNLRTDVFVKNLTSGAITRASSPASGVQGNGRSTHPAMNAGSTIVAFESTSTNLVSGDTNGSSDVFIKDMVTGTVTLVSSSTSGLQGNGNSRRPMVSADGTKVVFESSATNLVPGDTNGMPDVFMKDLITRVITRVSTSASGSQGNGHSSSPVLSMDGMTVAFMSSSQNLVSGDTNSRWDVFVKNLSTGAITRVSTSLSGVQGNGHSSSPVLSADGTRISFQSDASNLVSGDTNGVGDVFIKELRTSRIQRLSTSATGIQGNRLSSQPSISTDGKKVVFVSESTNLSPNDSSVSSDVYLVNLNATPVDGVISASTIVENSAAGTLVGAFTTRDADTTDTHTYSLAAGPGDADNSSFRISGKSLYTTRRFDFETQSRYTIRVRTVDAAGAWFEMVFAIRAIDQNEPPTVTLTNVVPTLAENTNTTAGVRIADIQVRNDALGTPSLAVAGPDAEVFEIIGTSLYLKPGVTLNARVKPSYEYTVRATDDTFTVNVRAGFRITAPVAQVLSPQPATDELRPFFSWMSVPTAARYEITVRELLSNNSSKVVEVTDGTTVIPLANYSVTATTYTPPSDFGIGRFSYWVRSVDATGVKSPWSQTFTFTIMTAVRINRLPDLRQQVARPVISWQTLPGAAQYDLWVDNITVTPATTQFVRLQTPETSWQHSADLPMGRYRIWLRGLNEGGTYARWSAPTDFEVLPSPAVDRFLSTFDATPTTNWQEVTGALNYEVVLKNAATGAEVFRETTTSNGATPSQDLAVGTYTWQVRAIGVSGYSSHFTAPSWLNVGGRPIANPVVVSNRVPTFSWLAVEGAVSYQIRVDRLDVPTTNVITLSGLTGISRTHTAPLAPGSYRFWVSAVGATSASVSSYSRSVDFTVAETESDVSAALHHFFASLSMLSRSALSEQATSSGHSFRPSPKSAPEKPSPAPRSASDVSEHLSGHVSEEIANSDSAFLAPWAETSRRAASDVERTSVKQDEESLVDIILQEWAAPGRLS